MYAYSILIPNLYMMKNEVFCIGKHFYASLQCHEHFSIIITFFNNYFVNIVLKNLMLEKKFTWKVWKNEFPEISGTPSLEFESQAIPRPRNSPLPVLPTLVLTQKILSEKFKKTKGSQCGWRKVNSLSNLIFSRKCRTTEIFNLSNFLGVQD